MDKKGLDYDGFRTMVAWMQDKISSIFANIKADYNTNIRKQIVCSDKEYLEMYNAGTLEQDKIYMVFQEEVEE